MTDDGTPSRPLKRQGGALALLAVIAVAVTGASPAWFAPNNSQTLLYRLVVHGAGLPAPRAFSDPSPPLWCFWASTYNLRSGAPDKPPGDDVPYITLSFFLEGAFVDLVGRGVIDSVAPDPGYATHHTLVYFAAGEGMPAARRQRHGVLSDFHLLHPFGEHYLASHGIPTRLDSLGAPTVKSYTAEESAAMVTPSPVIIQPSQCPTGD